MAHELEMYSQKSKSIIGLMLNTYLLSIFLKKQYFPIKKENKTEVTSVKLVLFKSVMSFETLTKVDQLAEIVKTRPGLRVVFSSF